MKNNFSNQADLYARFRPNYPAELYEYILGEVKHKRIAWDCATGNGQVAVELARQFSQVEATDISQKQLNHAVPATNINYQASLAESTPFPDNHFDLITVGQAVHWFNFDEFYKEVNRVAKPMAVIAIWGYGLIQAEETINNVILDYYSHEIRPYWDIERKHVDNRYTDIPFPFSNIQEQSYKMQKKWTITQLDGYLNTWSAIQNFIKQEGYNPVTHFIEKIKPLWPKENQTIEFIFPVFLKCGTVNK